MIKESCSLIGPEAHLVSPNQKWQSHMLPSLYEFPAKNLRYRLIPSKDIDDQRIMQSDWMRAHFDL